MKLNFDDKKPGVVNLYFTISIVLEVQKSFKCDQALDI